MNGEKGTVDLRSTDPVPFVDCIIVLLIVQTASKRHPRGTILRDLYPIWIPDPIGDVILPARESATYHSTPRPPAPLARDIPAGFRCRTPGLESEKGDGIAKNIHEEVKTQDARLEQELLEQRKSSRTRNQLRHYCSSGNEIDVFLQVGLMRYDAEIPSQYALLASRAQHDVPRAGGARTGSRPRVALERAPETRLGSLVRGEKTLQMHSDLLLIYSRGAWVSKSEPRSLAAPVP